MKRFIDYIKESLLEPEADIVDKKFCYKVGSYYNDGKIEGIIASLKDNGDPHLIMSLNNYKYAVTWDEAMKYNNTLKDGWHIPSKVEMEEIWHNDYKVTELLNKGFERQKNNKLEFWYWSSTESSNSEAYIIFMDEGIVYKYSKEYKYFYIPVISL